ncbi:hypothetical protein [Secundilactobacillus kimchicus]|uniref:hypothetical protein n=1 Tax=Secundilactobacillus kimchicus TaxID=528209 RepID=UPI0024A98C89|nr:hypothetical protein [Secundilactobacillus kimchicus]
MSDELKKLKRRLEYDMVDSQKSGDKEALRGLQIALYEISNLDKPFNFYHITMRLNDD